jgi:steroid delta-isomerase-like uncharacterized protein
VGDADEQTRSTGCGSRTGRRASTGEVVTAHAVPDPKNGSDSCTAATAANRSSIDLVVTVTQDVWNGRDYDRLDEFLADEFVQHGPMTGVEIHGRDEGLADYRRYENAFPDLESDVEFVFTDENGEYVCTYVANTGTHDGELMGMPATGVEGRSNDIRIHRIENGKLVEVWMLGDMFGLFTQLGAFPEVDSLGAQPAPSPSGRSERHRSHDILRVFVPAVQGSRPGRAGDGRYGRGRYGESIRRRLYRQTIGY